jgi:hypothetical protein
VQEGGDRYHGGDADGDVEVEDPPPGQVVGEQPAQQRAGDQRDGGHDAEHRLVLRPLPGRHDVADDRHDQGVQPAAAASRVFSLGERPSKVGT